MFCFSSTCVMGLTAPQVSIDRIGACAAFYKCLIVRLFILSTHVITATLSYQVSPLASRSVSEAKEPSERR